MKQISKKHLGLLIASRDNLSENGTLNEVQSRAHHDIFLFKILLRKRFALRAVGESTPEENSSIHNYIREINRQKNVVTVLKNCFSYFDFFGYRYVYDYVKNGGGEAEIEREIQISRKELMTVLLNTKV